MLTPVAHHPYSQPNTHSPTRTTYIHPPPPTPTPHHLHPPPTTHTHHLHPVTHRPLLRLHRNPTFQPSPRPVAHNNSLSTTSPPIPSPTQFHKAHHQHPPHIAQAPTGLPHPTNHHNLYQFNTEHPQAPKVKVLGLFSCLLDSMHCTYVMQHLQHRGG